VAGGAYAYYYRRLKKIKLQKLQLEKLVKERTAVISDQVEELKAQSEELGQQAEYLKELNRQLEAQKQHELEKAVAQNKFEIASEVLHDVGNALVGFGSYVTRINRTLEQHNNYNAQNLELFLKTNQPAIATVLGAERAAALTVVAGGILNSQKNNKDEIRSSVTELLNIISHIEQILNIQRQYVRSHAGVHERKPVDLVNIIDGCRAMLFASFEKKGIGLEVNILPGRHIIKGDQTKLMQVILNVFKNSVEAIDLASDNKNITVRLQTVDDITELTFTDSGCGFDGATGSRLFDRGFTTKTTGTGLGLYNCRSIVETHGGTFCLKSDGPGRGAVTVITFNRKTGPTA
jgi:signal transduction histidine kinase